MNPTTLAPKPGAVPQLLVDIASVSSRLFWLVRNSTSGAAAGLPIPTAVFTRFSDAVAARGGVDATPPLVEHPQGLCRLQDAVIVDCVGPGRVNWIHPSGDVRVELARQPGSAEYYPIAAIRRAVTARPRFDHEVVPVGLREANLVVERLHRRLGKVQGHKFAIGLRRVLDQELDGVAIAARPVSRHLDDGITAEVPCRPGVRPCRRSGRAVVWGHRRVPRKGLTMRSATTLAYVVLGSLLTSACRTEDSVDVATGCASGHTRLCMRLA